MIRRFVCSAALASAILVPSVIAPVAAHASLFGSSKSDTPTVKVKNAKTVKMTLKNRSSAPMNLMIEDQAITLQPNAEYALNAPEGTRVFGEDKTLRVTVTKDLAGTTCSFR